MNGKKKKRGTTAGERHRKRSQSEKRDPKPNGETEVDRTRTNKTAESIISNTSQHFKGEMEKLIPLINELQSVFKSTGYGEIDLPQIVVVGSQSCGKSSVLESLVGRSFLPRGSGIVTRCPIILQLTHVTEEDEDGNKEWCVIQNDDGDDTKIVDYDKVREAIERKTELSAGTNLGISMQPIIVSVFSPHVVSLTVVDLPGVVKNPVGDQPKDIEAQVQNLILKYITSANALILAVSPANADIATSDSIKIAKEVDPQGDRTLAVLTKLDLMDKGTDATKVLNGEIIDVKLGIVGVVNRSQADIVNNKSIEEAMNDERSFLNKTYPTHFGVIGSEYLAKRLNALLQEHIKKTLPGLIDRINEMITQYEQLKKELGTEIAVGGKVSHWVLIQAVSDFIVDFKNKVDSRQEHNLKLLKNTQLLGPIINGIFSKFCASLNLEVEKLEHSIDHRTLETQLSNTTNVEGFTSIEGVFKNLAREWISAMEKPSADCADEVQKVLVGAIKDSLKDKRLLRLNEEIAKVTKKLLISQLQKTKTAINEHFKIQTTMIFSTNQKFLDKLKTNDSEEEVLGKVPTQPNQIYNPPSQRASFPVTSVRGNSGSQSQYVKELLNAYMDVKCGQISDYIPNHIYYHLYEQTMENIREEIIKAADGREAFLLQENEDIVRQRREANEMLESLLKAYDIVNGIDSTM